MRRFIPIALVISMAAVGFPLNLAGQTVAGSLTGTALQPNLQPLSNVRVQIRSVRTATVVFSTRSGPGGEFLFGPLQPDTYVIELVDSTGSVVGMTAPTAVGTDTVQHVSVMASAPGTAAGSGQRAGFSILGLGPTTSIAVLGAAGAAAITAVVATRPNASPSR
jgi:hypothetical protein